MAHVEPTGLPVDDIAPALRDALSDVSTELVDAQHTAHGSLADVTRYENTVLVSVAVDLGRPATVDDVVNVRRDLGGFDAPVLLRGIARTTEGK